MGREAKAKRPTGVVLPAADYWELRALIRDVEAVEMDAMKAAQHFGQQAQAAKLKADAKFKAMADAHGLDRSKTYGWNDATCELIETRTPTTGPETTK